MTQAPALVKDLFANGVQMTIARYPNTGFLSVSGTNSSSTITAAGMNKPSGYWNGATCRIRSSNYTFESRSVSTFDGTTIVLSRGTDFPIKVGWGFYLDNKLEELDSPGEWYCDSISHIVYFYPPEGIDPNQMTVEASILDNGIVSSQSNITIQGLGFRCQSQAAICFTGSISNVRIISNDISDSFENGVYIVGKISDCSIDGNAIRDVNGCGMYLENPSRTTILNNTVKNVGLVQGYGISGTMGMIGICSLFGSDNVIKQNVVDSVGYIGIRVDGANHLVENNVVTNSVLKLADGGALYSYGRVSSGTTWRDNIVVDVIGNNDGVPPPATKDATGIYLDGGSNRMVVEGNTIRGASSWGIFVNLDNTLDTLRGNLIYDCGNDNGGSLGIAQNTSLNYGGHLIAGNVFYPLDSTSVLVQLSTWGDFTLPGKFDSNYYCCPYNNIPIQISTLATSWSSRKFSLEEWKTFSGQDQNSKGLYKRVTPFAVTDSSAPDIMPNGEFQSNIAGWSCWGQNSEIVYSTDPGLNGGCLRFRLFNATPSSWGIAISPQIALAGSECYRLSFSVRASQPGIVSAFVQQNHAPYAGLTPKVDFPMSSTSKDYEWFFSLPTADAQSRINFQIGFPDSVVYLDNIALRMVKGYYLAPDYQSPAFVNTTAQPMTIGLGSNSFRDLDGNPVPSAIQLPPYSSKVVVRDGPGVQTAIKNLQTSSKVQSFRLFQNYPNPFNPSTRIGYFLPSDAKVRLEVFDSIGRLAGILVDETQRAGDHSVTLNERGLATGVYICRLTAGGFTQSIKMVLIK